MLRALRPNNLVEPWYSVNSLGRRVDYVHERRPELIYENGGGIEAGRSAVKIAELAESYEVNVAPHNFTGHLSAMMSAQFCAVVPNLSIMEFNVEGLERRDELVLQQQEVSEGTITVSDRTGWGIDVN